MPSIPSVGRNIAEPQLREPTISREQFRGDQTVSNAISFASQATAQYALDEKKQFDLARLTEARNILDVRETQLLTKSTNISRHLFNCFIHFTKIGKLALRFCC